MDKLNFNKPAVYDIRIKADNNTVTCKLEVVDTTPPTAVTMNRVIWAGESIKAKSFVKDISDATDVTVSYKVPPDFTKAVPQRLISY